MTLCSTVISSALKKLGLSSPSTTEISDGLPYLQGLYGAMVNGGLFGRLNDIIVVSDYTAQEFDRILVNTASAVTITVPDTYERTDLDPETTPDDPDPSNRPARDLACIVVNVLDSEDKVVLIRDGYYGAWVDCDSIALTDTAPLSARDLNGLASKLALAMSDDFSDRPVNPDTRANAARFMLALATKPGSPRYATSAEYF